MLGENESMSPTDSKTVVVICPSCDTRIRFGKAPRLSDVITCPECEESFEVISTSPLRLDWIPSYYDDEYWDDDDEDDDDDDDDLDYDDLDYEDFSDDDDWPEESDEW